MYEREGRETNGKNQQRERGGNNRKEVEGEQNEHTNYDRIGKIDGREVKGMNTGNSGRREKKRKR